MTDKKYFTKEPIIHSHIEDVLEDDHKWVHTSVSCDNCKALLHCSINECMQTWFETEFGNYCTDCMKITNVMEELELKK